MAEVPGPLLGRWETRNEFLVHSFDLAQSLLFTPKSLQQLRLGQAEPRTRNSIWVCHIGCRHPNLELSPAATQFAICRKLESGAEPVLEPRHSSIECMHATWPLHCASKCLPLRRWFFTDCSGEACFRNSACKT